MAAAKPAEAPASAAAPTDGSVPAAEAAPAPVAEAPKPELTIDERAKLSRLQGDLMWLVREGYVTEFIDGRLFAPPPMVEARKKEIEGEEHDPENFPDVPASAEAPAAPVDAAPAAEAAPATEPVAPVESTPAPVAEAPAAEEPKSEPPAAPAS